MDKKYAIHVPHQLLSEAVQKYLFENGYEWYTGATVKEVCGENVYLTLDGGGSIVFSDKADFLDEDYTILTVDEFFKREAEKEEGVLKMLNSEVRAIPGGFSINPICDIAEDIPPMFRITWLEYDRIGTLKPKGGSDG